MPSNTRSPMANHKWQPIGGCAENPGVFDSGNGGLIYEHVCVHCGLIRRSGEDYTGHRPGNTWGPVYTTPRRIPIGKLRCNVDVVRQACADAERSRICTSR